MTISDRSHEFATPVTDRPSWEIRPGVDFPNWSAIRSPIAENALRARLALRDFNERWRNYDEGEDWARTAILRYYATHGRAPTIEELSAAEDIAAIRLRGILERLRQRDLVVLGTSKDRIIGAYPFTDRDTGHRVQFDDLTVNAMCAIDALGIGAMCEREIAILSHCPACDRPIRVTTQACGTMLGSYDPRSAAVWSALNYAGGCGATSSCMTTAFFCSGRHLERWRAVKHAGIHGQRLSVDHAHEVGVAIFSPMLATTS